MKKLLIVPAILAMTALSGSAFAQRVNQGNGSPTTANGSGVAAIGSPIVGNNIAVPLNISVLTNGNNQNNGVGQGNTGTIGIGATSSFVGSR